GSPTQPAAAMPAARRAATTSPTAAASSPATSTAEPAGASRVASAPAPAPPERETIVTVPAAVSTAPSLCPFPGGLCIAGSLGTCRYSDTHAFRGAGLPRRGTCGHDPLPPHTDGARRARRGPPPPLRRPGDRRPERG